MHPHTHISTHTDICTHTHLGRRTQRDGRRERKTGTVTGSRHTSHATTGGKERGQSMHIHTSTHTHARIHIHTQTYTPSYPPLPHKTHPTPSQRHTTLYPSHTTNHIAHITIATSLRTTPPNHSSHTHPHSILTRRRTPRAGVLTHSHYADLRAGHGGRRGVCLQYAHSVEAGKVVGRVCSVCEFYLFLSPFSPSF